MRARAIVLIYGKGGHRAQMERLYARLKPGLDGRAVEVVGICEDDHALKGFRSYSHPSVRDKHSLLKSLVTFPASILWSVSITIRVVREYRVIGVVSTGPGIAVVPSILLKITGARIVFLETWARYETRSVTGRVMYRVADRFYIQNPSLKKYYPKAIYGGLL